MALRVRRGARPGRVARGRAGFVGLACTLYAASGLAATWPAARHWDGFFAERAAERSGVTPGDHLQTGYNLWLVGHQLERARPPWRDPYSFQPEAGERVNFAGWPFGLVYWPLGRVLGAVSAWNFFVLLGYVGAGSLACLWLRSLGLPREAALVGGLAFALAPYRVAQSAGHLLGPISMLLPLALWAFERRRLVVAGLALASIPLSGQVHLALGAIPFFLLYAVCRTRERRALIGALAAAGAAIIAGLAVYALAISGSVGAAGRSLAQVERYSAGWLDFLTRGVRGERETFVFLGWLTPLLALAGLVALTRARRYRLALGLATGAVVPILVALGTNLPGYATAWRHLPGLRETRVPERLLPIACLALAALAAFALARIRGRAVLAVALALVAVDLRLTLYGTAAADEDNGAYAALEEAPPGRLLELPVILPDVQLGSVYLYYAMQAPRERPAGYSTTAPTRADALLRELRRGNCGAGPADQSQQLARLGVRYVAVHRKLYRAMPHAPARCMANAERMLAAAGFRPLREVNGVAVYHAAGE